MKSVNLYRTEFQCLKFKQMIACQRLKLVGATTNMPSTLRLQTSITHIIYFLFPPSPPPTRASPSVYEKDILERAVLLLFYRCSSKLNSSSEQIQSTWAVLSTSH